MLQRVFTFLLCVLTFTAHAQTAATTQVEFLDAEAAAEVIRADTAYFRRVTPVHVQAVTRQPLGDVDPRFVGIEAEVRWINAIQEFTAIEQVSIIRMTQIADAFLRDHYPAINDHPWKFIKLADQVCGLPHTRGDTIVLPASFVQYLCAADGAQVEGGPQPQMIATVAGILVHEICHVDQRLEPDAWNTVYDTWGYVHVEDLPSHEWIDERETINPDGTDTNWLYPVSDTLALRPLMIFTKTDYPTFMQDNAFVVVHYTRASPSDAWAVALDDQGVPITEPLRENDAYAAAFSEIGSVGHAYHPNETSAGYIGDRVAAMLQEIEVADGPLHDALRDALGPADTP